MRRPFTEGFNPELKLHINDRMLSCCLDLSIQVEQTNIVCVNCTQMIH